MNFANSIIESIKDMVVDVEVSFSKNKEIEEI